MLIPRTFYPQEPTDPGVVIGDKYRVERVIGAGGFGIVVVARHVELGHRVAIKSLRARFVDHPVILARFRNEARAAATIQSEHVVRVFDVSPPNAELPYMVMEYLDGEDLAARLAKEGPMRVEDVVAFTVEACAGVAIAHAAGIIHRDLKPSNLFLARRDDGTTVVKVLDFGISKQASAQERALTTSTTIHGTPAYMAPEQLLVRTPIDARADVWALGVIVYELLTRRTPWRAPSMPSLIARILHEPPTPLSVLRATVPRDVDAIVRRCLQKDPADRYESVVALAEELSRVCPARTEATVVQMHAALERARQRTSLLPLPTTPPVVHSIIEAPVDDDLGPSESADPVTVDRGRKRSLALAPVGVALGVACGLLAALWTAGQHAAEPHAASLAGPAARAVAVPPSSVAPAPSLAPSPSSSIAAIETAQPPPTSTPRAPPIRPAPSQAPPRAADDDVEFGGRK